MSIPNSVANSVRRLDHTPSRANSIVVNRMDSMTFKDQPTPTTEIPTILLPSDKGDTTTELKPATDDEIKGGVNFNMESDSDRGKPRMPIFKPAIKSIQCVKIANGVNTSLPNGMSLCTDHKEANKDTLLPPGEFALRLQSQSQSQSLLPPKSTRRRKCPPGVHREDYSRPMYRKDIFYSGSILHIPEFQSQPNVQVYMKSITSIPPVFPPMEDNKSKISCSCLPKSLVDTLKEMMDVSLLKDPLFLVPCLGNLFGAIGLFIPYIYITQKAMALGIEDSQAAFLLSVIGMFQQSALTFPNFRLLLLCRNYKYHRQGLGWRHG
jgi:hypothetical protein